MAFLNVIVLVGAMLFLTLLGWAVLGAAKLWQRAERRPRPPIPPGHPSSASPPIWAG